MVYYRVVSSAGNPVRVKSASLAETWAAFSTAISIGIASLALAGCVARPPNAAAPSQETRTGSAEAPDGTRAAAPMDAAAAMIGSATAMLGQPYRFGGASPGGFDCSGLVNFAARSAGLDLPRTAKDQLASGVRVARREIEPGDLVFMRLAHKELHVGIAIGGERFIHAPASGGRVRIDSLARAPYSAGFIGARRVIGGGRASGL
jgi:cell wall-associated NlpC family hydrolase